MSLRWREGRFVLTVLVGLLLAVTGVILLAARRSAASRAEVDARLEARRAGERVRVARATVAPQQRTLRLQGEVHPFASVTLYGKVAGYLGEVRVDKGDRVRAGQLLATIVSPELDAQVSAARADARNKRHQAQRLQRLAAPGVVAVQDVDTAVAGADVAEAQEVALRTQNAYRTLRAPFAGIVTARFADPGALIQSAAGAQTGALPVVTIANTARLRIYVYLDQATASFVKVGDTAVVRVAERPGWSRQAQVARVSGELALRTRTMLTEVDVDNADGALLPGSFVDVQIEIHVPSLVQIPAEAVFARGTQRFAAIVDAQHRLRLRPLRIADDDGETVRVLDGVAAGDLVAINVGESAAEGAPVQPVGRGEGDLAKR